MLVNITNDAWYGESSAPYQLLAMAAMRAVETKVPMMRVANTGISAVIEPTGEITARTPLFKRGTEIEDVAWRPMRPFTLWSAIFSRRFASSLALAGLIAALLSAAHWHRPEAAHPLIRRERRQRDHSSRNGQVKVNPSLMACNQE